MKKLNITVELEKSIDIPQSDREYIAEVAQGALEGIPELDIIVSNIKVAVI